MPKPASPICVVCAVLEDGTGRVLVAQRPAHKHLGLKWEFPGGKVEPGEAPAEALRRELREELGCDAVPGENLGGFVHDYGDIQIAMRAFRCRLAPGSPAPSAHEHAALRWARLDEIATMDLAAADWPLLEELRRAERCA